MRADIVEEAEFRDDHLGIVVKLYRNKSVRNPLRSFSTRVFSEIQGRDNVYTIPGLTMDLDRPSFEKVGLRTLKAEALSHLIAKAEKLSVELAQQDIDQMVDDRVEKDQYKLASGKPKTRKTGKTARKKARLQKA